MVKRVFEDKTLLLTVVIPSYNVAEYLEHAVVSVASSKYIEYLEVIIVNDGSTDDTAVIGRDLEKKYGCVRLINKKNGGHGSTINVGLKNARGKYFRLLDGDDYFDTRVFDKFLEKLEKETSDMVFTTYVENYAKTGVVRNINPYSKLIEGKQYLIDDIDFDYYGPMLPCTTIKTSLMQKAGIEIDEHCFYVDQEYNLFSYILSKTVTYYDMPIYHYRLERDGQSMTKTSLIKNVLHHEKVSLRLIKEFTEHSGSLSDKRTAYLVDRVIIPMCHAQYTIVIDYMRSKKYFSSFDKKLKLYQRFYNDPGIAGRTVKLYRSTNGNLIKLHVPVKKMASIARRAVGK